ncbi:hypothetical protein LEP1GSC016_1972 [Leptospira borgpetersenii serovar Hardjo-bovis str. Sponselee]|uniref:Uncharacterized protein n=1 Tax=Leptospira borgpetersenii serovar Hardjo-bovis str. Sponselee TaxID=1303729 RepID=M6C0R0_LEPBO|nr:hypothetical protein LBK6_11970 [Leptospira borgpetersenii serovar Hardjo]AWV70798.1 hypothetical protein B9T54_12905 [Leptospira borgpetersenii serovar Hardjo-bovis]EMJ84326.1 hypothetical protein LEP1GSC016_1972 [Leptospira borgpetersenii serovar Hardjo-bovis str. Sponselee]TQE53191.1 hypothetical protein FFZ95_08155 [Leptospira borgpetersenii]AMX62279.1 hypothetical protein LBK9_12010 [Leptospira borgpetersenii serovar Hardjo]
MRQDVLSLSLQELEILTSKGNGKSGLKRYRIRNQRRMERNRRRKYRSCLGRFCCLRFTRIGSDSRSGLHLFFDGSLQAYHPYGRRLSKTKRRLQTGRCLESGKRNG